MAVAFRAAGTPSLNSGAGPHVVAYPAGVASGDLLLIQFRLGSSTAPTTPAGWTALFAGTKFAGTTIYATVFYRVAGGSEPSTVSITKANAASIAVMSAYSGCDPATPIDVSATANLATSGTTYTAPTVTTTKANAQVLRMYWAWTGSGAGTTPNASDTERYDTYDSWDVAVHELGDRVQAVAGAAGTSNATGPALSGGLAATIALAPGVPGPVADFTGTPLTGAASLSVTFTDASTNTPTGWSWDFGDGGTSTSQNPSHSYTVSGIYTVALTATNASGSDTKTRTAYVRVADSTAQNPTHVYAAPGVYTVSLAVANASGQDTRTRTGYINVGGGFVPQIIWFTPAPATGAPAAPTFESATAYSTVANRPAVTGTTRTFTSSATLATALNASSPGDLVQYNGTGILDIGGNYVGLAGRRYTGYVTIDLGLPASANHVRFTGGGGAGLPAVGIYNSAFLRIYGGEITNPPPKSGGHDGLHIYGAGHAHDGSTNHITWYNLAVHDTVDSGIKMLPNVPFGGSGQTAADLTIADCDIQAEVYRIGLDKTVDTHPEQGTGQHCCLLADVDPSGATYPSFLRNRIAIDGHDSGPPASQGGGSIIELGFPDALSTISGCTLVIRGLNTLMNAQQQTAGNGLNLWGDAQVNVAIPFIQHTNATGSAVCNFPPGYNRSGVVVAYGRHTSTNRNAYEGTNPWQLGPTYRDVA